MRLLWMTHASLHPFQLVESCSRCQSRTPWILNIFPLPKKKEYFIRKHNSYCITLSKYRHRQQKASALSRRATDTPSMIGTSTYDYVFIRACIVGLHTIAPLSILYCLVLILYYGFRPAICHRIPLPLEIWAIAEAAFYVLVHVWYRKQLQSEAIHPPARSRQERKELVERCNANVPDPEEYLQKWFLGARAEDIKRDNVKEFMLWAFFNRGGPPGEDDEELEEYVAVTENLLGREIEGGRGSAQCLRLTLDQVNMLHRSIIWYFVRLEPPLRPSGTLWLTNFGSVWASSTF